MSRSYDIVIVGGGMVGASLAAALSPLTLSVAVVEAWPPSSASQPSYDDRSTAVAEGSRRIFDGIGCWKAIASSATPITRIHVSDQGRFGFTRLDCRDYGVRALGHVVENRNLGAALWRVLEDAERVDVISPARVESVEVGGTTARVVIRRGDESTEKLHASLLVAADGARSAIREMLRLGESTWDYGQEAMIANVTPAMPHGNEAFERFTETGPLALLPMSGNRCSLVWTLRPDAAREVQALDDDEFLARLQETFGFRLGRFVRVGKRARYPLKLVRAKRQSEGRVLLIGNAAHAIHPVAGQGFNLGLRDVAALADVVADALEAGRCVGDPKVLDQYARWRRGDQRRVAAMTDSLIRVFTSPLAPVRTARGLGLLGLDLAVGPKEMFARQTMGLSGRLPRLARGIPLT